MVGDQQKRDITPILMNIMIFLGIFVIIPLILIFVLKLPWYLSFIYPGSIVIGIILIICGLLINSKALNQLNLKYSSKDQEKAPDENREIDGLKDELKTEAIFAYTRNPMYFGQSLVASGLFLIFPYTFLLFIVLLFVYVLYSSARREEKELHQKFGEEYLIYKKNTPFFIPNPAKRKKKMMK
jgi:protein-S-isoprenylcysteine O-methyltransferase Ste14